MKKSIKISLVFLATLSTAGVAADDSQTKYLCKTEVSGGLAYRGEHWAPAKIGAGDVYEITMTNGKMSYANQHNVTNNVAMDNCSAIFDGVSYVCQSQWAMLRFEPSSMRFVHAVTAGYTDEFKKAGMSPTGFKPNVSLGTCEKL